jgi:hypothetical protein
VVELLGKHAKVKKSYYFSELSSAYDAELQDLLTDSEGSPALKARLKEKRQELKAILPMIEFSPEMVVPVFYDGFTFTNAQAMAAAVMSEPDEGNFPSWDDLAAFVKVEPWAAPHVSTVLAERAGADFMVMAACLEFLRKFDTVTAPVADDEDSDREKDEDDDGDEDGRDLAEAGDDWLGEQGFDSLKS